MGGQEWIGLKKRVHVSQVVLTYARYFVSDLVLPPQEVGAVKAEYLAREKDEKIEDFYLQG